MEAGAIDVARQVHADGGAPTLLGGEGLHQRQSAGLLFREHAGAGIDAGVGVGRLGPEEQGRHHHLVAQHEAVDDHVVAVDLPAPGLVVGRRAHEAHPVEPLPVVVPLAGDLTDGVVELHHVAGQVVAGRAEALAQQPQGGLALGWAHLLQAHAVAQQVGMDVAPGAPGLALQVEGGTLALLGAQLGQAALGRRHQGGGRHTGRLNGEQAGHGPATHGHAHEVLSQSGAGLLHVVLQALWQREGEATGGGGALPRAVAGEGSGHGIPLPAWARDHRNIGSPSDL